MNPELHQLATAVFELPCVDGMAASRSSHQRPAPKAWRRCSKAVRPAGPVPRVRVSKRRGTSRNSFHARSAVMPAAGFGECNPLSACTNARRTPAARKRGTTRIVANTSRSTTASSDSQDDRVALACAPGAKAVAALRVSSRAAESLEASRGAAAAVGLRRPRRPLPLCERGAPRRRRRVLWASRRGMGILGRLSVRHAAAAVGAALRRRRRVPGPRSGGQDSAARRSSASVRAAAATAAAADMYPSGAFAM